RGGLPLRPRGVDATALERALLAVAGLSVPSRTRRGHPARPEGSSSDHEVSTPRRSSAPCPTYDPDVAYRYALEVEQGALERRGVDTSWSLELPSGLGG
ncbi:MAG: hypothetical protein R6T85_10490, partial [Egibacteraceae bacterium]